MLLPGLSPRGRGNLGAGRDVLIEEGSIPAWAGKPKPPFPPPAGMGVYPRVGGETGSIAKTTDGEQGLSPRGRGNQKRQDLVGHPPGSIPAWAGKPRWRSSTRSGSWVYPRVGGETLPLNINAPNQTGLSPRGRGNLVEGGIGFCFPRSIPAWAGKPRGERARRRRMMVYPRVGGETAHSQR